MPYSDIPQTIKTSFESSEYASWKRDNEVERIERAGTEKEIIYIIEVESAQDVDMDLHYSADGILIKAVNDDGDGNNESLLPDAPSSTVTAVYVLPIKVTEAINASQYSGYVVDDAEYVETPTGNYYWIELEQGEKEVKVKINENGEFI